MALPEQPAPAAPSESRAMRNQPAPPLSKQQRRILPLLHQGDLIWEIAEDPAHRTVYNEKRGCPQRLPTAVVTVLEQQGWIRRRPNTQAGRLDSWELTAPGRAITLGPRPTRAAPSP